MALTPLTDAEVREFVDMVIKLKLEVEKEKEMAQIPLNQPLQQNSITKLQALVPVRVATSKVLEGNWSGRELNATRVVGSMFGGAHFIMQIGYNQQVGYAASFRLVFVAHMPLERGQSLTDPEVIAEAERMSESFMHMLNMRRVEGPAPKSMEGTIANINAAVLRADPIPGKPLTGKRADVLIVDDLDQPKPVV